MDSVPEESSVRNPEEGSGPVQNDEGSDDERPPDGLHSYKAHVIAKFDTRVEVHYDSPEMQVLLKAFKSYQKAFWPHTVILHGKPGVGKSALARSIVLGWAQGKLYQDMSYAFFFSVREIKWTEKSSLAELISEEWPYLQASVATIMSKPERLLFVLDGFDDLDLALLQDDMRPSGDWEDEQPIYILMYSLLMKVLLPQSCLIITTRDTDLEKLKSLAVSPLYILVGGLSAMRRTRLLLENISDDQQRKHVVRTVIDNNQIFDQCQVPAICSLVCEALKLQEKLGERCAPVCWTLTSLYATLVFHQLTPREPFQSCLSHREQVTLMGLCSMAAEGVWNMRSVFYDDDLQNYGLKEAAISALFHMNILLQVDDSTKQYYIFFHLSLQDFCAALYYLLKGLKKWNQHCLFIENPKRSIMTLKRTNFNTHLLGMKRFLFGLMNKDTMRTLEALLGCSVSPAVKQRLQHWVFEVGQQVSATSPADVLDVFYYLFESQDEEFVCWALNSFQEVWLQVSQKMDLMVSSYCLQHCQNLKTLRVDVRDILVDKNAELCPVALPQSQGKSLIMELWEDFCSVLSTHPKLNKLDLGSSVLKEWAMKILCLKLRNPACNVQNLMLKDAEIAAGLQYLWMTLISNRNLKYLNLGNNNLKDDDVKLVCEALRHPNCSLETLRLDSCELTSASYSMISELLLSPTSLKSLSLARNGVTEKSMGQLCGALSSSRCTLQKLILDSCELSLVSCHGLVSALSGNMTLTHLCLSNNSLRTEEVRLLCRFMKGPRCALQRLILNQCDLKGDACGFLALTLINNRTLTHLSLTKNPVVDDGVKFLCEALKEPTCHLQELELVECWLTGDCCVDLASMITMNQHLKSLDLGYNNLGDNGVIALCKGLKQNNSSLRRLGLEACGLTFESCEALSSTLACNQCLTSLNLVKNSFSTPGMLKLCYAFRHLTSNLRIIGLWKQQYPAEVRRQLEEIQLTRPHTVITGDWYSLEEDDRNWWKS
ncbi:NACHT, LRR and PYD domains-containing protein 5 isoform X2 [Chionomys nivalis]|uniref:NACHT, LRR and PYD domains-containing protein 5 isoform X2 n=1 Tax=Chionomys nivalis TaxID=269649 RepID=UPI002591B955|nr:NACHT, LRR and PYD domains-containing protein 5 isoform X2 [Chionomys nivalis]